MSTAVISLLANVTEYYTFYSNIALFSIGLVASLSNIVAFVTLRCFRGNQSAFYFIVESTCNIGLFLAIFPAYFYQYHTGIDPARRSIVWCKLRDTISETFGLCSLFTICFQTFDQFMATHPRLNYRRISSLKMARRFVFCTVCVVVLHNSPFIILTRIDPSGSCGITSAAVNAYNTFFYYPVLSSALPLVVAVSFSVLAYRNVRRIVRRQISVVRRRLDRQLTTMVLARVISMILLGLPYICYNVYRVNLGVTDRNQVAVAVSDLLGAVAYSLLYLNFATTFYVFLGVSGRFRRQTRQGMARKCCARSTGRCRLRAVGGKKNQVTPEIVEEAVSDIQSA